MLLSNPNGQSESKESADEILPLEVDPAAGWLTARSLGPGEEGEHELVASGS
jgi:hypothetical protein